MGRSSVWAEQALAVIEAAVAVAGACLTLMAVQARMHSVAVTLVVHQSHSLHRERAHRLGHTSRRRLRGRADRLPEHFLWVLGQMCHCFVLALWPQ